MPTKVRQVYFSTDSRAAITCKFSIVLAGMFCAILFLGATQIAVAGELQGTVAGSAQEKEPEPEVLEQQGAPRATELKKKIVLTQFDVINTLHVDDISNIYDGLPSTLSNWLANSGEFLSAYSGRSIPAEADEAQRETILQIAGEHGAQFLISGMVVNAGIRQKKGYLGTSIGGYKERHIEVEFAVYDANTGNRLLLRRLDEQIEGDVMVGNNKPFGSSIFFDTKLGQAIHRLLDHAVEDIRDTLGKVPFSAHIIRTEGRKVFLDAGSDSLLKSGDKLVAYARDTGSQVIGLKGDVLGATDHAVDVITLVQAQPKFAIGELSEEATKLGIKAGNIAKIDPDEQRKVIASQIAAQQMAKAQQEAKEEAERLKAEQAAQAEAERIKAEQAAKNEAARIKAEKKAQALAKAQAAAKVRAAKLKARREARAARIRAAKVARARAQAREKARLAAEAKAAKLKAIQEAKAETARLKAEAEARACAELMEQQSLPVGPVAGSGVAKTETMAGVASTQPVAESGDEKAVPQSATVAPAETAHTETKPLAPLKLKQVKP